MPPSKLISQYDISITSITIINNCMYLVNNGLFRTISYKLTISMNSLKTPDRVVVVDVGTKTDDLPPFVQIYTVDALYVVNDNTNAGK